MEKRIRLNMLDNLECLSVDKQQSDFPEHFHESFCISLIREGIECIKLQDTTLHGLTGNITLTNPYEIHANPILDKDTNVSFDTLYFSQDLIDQIIGKKGVVFKERQIEGKELEEAFSQIKTAFFRGESERLEALTQNFIRKLYQEVQSSIRTATPAFSAVWSEILLFIDHHLEEKFTIDQLAGFVNQDKYTFSRNFRNKYGMSPMNYVLMKKIFKAKADIEPDTELTQIAYKYHFSDQAHFSKTFKRFIGISPQTYKNQLRKV